MNASTRPVALVTGAGRNIGRAIALALASDGFAVVVNARSNRDEAESVVCEIETAGGEAIPVLADVSDRTAVDEMVAQVQSRFGRLDVLVNNAAIRVESEFGKTSYEAWRCALAVCLDGAFHCTQAVLPLLQASGRGRVINVGGLTAHTGAANRVHVVTAKAGLVGFTRALATEFGPQGITVNCVAPGLIGTKRDASAARPQHHAVHQTLVGRRGEPQEVAEAVRWLASEGARYVTGQVVHVNGGAFLG
jgi:3-oxoacyl-[acyl-carrier protein] reductase